MSTPIPSGNEAHVYQLMWHQITAAIHSHQNQILILIFSTDFSPHVSVSWIHSFCLFFVAAYTVMTTIISGKCLSWCLTDYIPHTAVPTLHYNIWFARGEKLTFYGKVNMLYVLLRVSHYVNKWERPQNKNTWNWQIKLILH